MIATVCTILHNTPLAFSALIQGSPCIFTTTTINKSLKIAYANFAIKPAVILLANSLKMSTYRYACKMACIYNAMRLCCVLLYLTVSYQANNYAS